jgi:Flp pilus assembly pilin Flp
MKEEKMDSFKRFLMEEDGIGVVEIILILVVLIAAVAIFKDRITALVQSIFSKIEGGARGI